MVRNNPYRGLWGKYRNTTCPVYHPELVTDRKVKSRNNRVPLVGATCIQFCLWRLLCAAPHQYGELMDGLTDMVTTRTAMTKSKRITNELVEFFMFRVLCGLCLLEEASAADRSSFLERWCPLAANDRYFQAYNRPLWISCRGLVQPFIVGSYWLSGPVTTPGAAVVQPSLAKRGGLGYKLKNCVTDIPTDLVATWMTYSCDTPRCNGRLVFGA